MDKITIKNLGLIVAKKRGRTGIRAVAKDIGISAATLSRIENGRLPALDTFGKVCAWLEVDPGEVLGYVAPQKASADAPRAAAHELMPKLLRRNQRS